MDDSGHALELFRALPFFTHAFPSFFDLPREIRDQILFYSCGNKYVITTKPAPPFWYRGKLIPTVYDGNSKYSDWDFPPQYDYTTALLNMFRVSHQFYDEAVAAFYSSSEFHFEDMIHWGRLLDTLPIEYQNRIRELDLHITTEEVDQSRAMFKEKAATHLRGLRKVYITIEMRVFQHTRFKELNNLCLNTSKSLPLLQEGIISIQYHYAEFEREALSKEDAEKIFQRMAEGMR